jgi:hypothetical protein
MPIQRDATSFADINTELKLETNRMHRNKFFFSEVQATMENKKREQIL